VESGKVIELALGDVDLLEVALAAGDGEGSAVKLPQPEAGIACGTIGLEQEEEIVVLLFRGQRFDIEVVAADSCNAPGEGIKLVIVCDDCSYVT
jgi:hypothetical protein